MLVDAVLESGVTQEFLLRRLGESQPRSLRLAVLLDKPSRRLKPVRADYSGFKIPNEFVVGYGLDYSERYRNLKDVCVLSLPPE